MEQEWKPEERSPSKVLVIMAHPDDIEFGVAGSVAHWVQHGAEVVYCIVTDGAAGSNEPDADLKQLVQTRQEEQDAAAKTVGVERVHYLGYQDGVLQPTMGIRRELTRLIRQEKPDRVVCQDPTTVFAREWYINHPDHRAAGESAIYAVIPSAETRPIFMDLLAEGLEPHKVTDLYMTLTMNPTHAVDISDTFEHKLEALLCHKSQLGDGADARKWVTEWNAEAGEKMGWKYAETFRVMTFVRPEPNGDKQDETGR